MNNCAKARNDQDIPMIFWVFRPLELYTWFELLKLYLLRWVWRLRMGNPLDMFGRPVAKHYLGSNQSTQGLPRHIWILIMTIVRFYVFEYIRIKTL